jgi:Reverse transcriptase (RNA-dependent DNA polymerase)
MKGRSTVTNLMEFCNFVISEIEDGNQVDGVYTDISKAFDRVNHSLFQSESYLTGRTQRVKMEDYLSEFVYRHSGVPLGSHLGPLFFINDVDGVLRIFVHVSALGYTDDLKLFKQIVNVEVCQRYQSDLDRLQKWCLENKFELNVSKCKAIKAVEESHRTRLPNC